MSIKKGEFSHETSIKMISPKFMINCEFHMIHLKINNFNHMKKRAGKLES